MSIKHFLLVIVTFLSFSISAQNLQPGFDKNEYLELMALSSRFGDSSYFEKIAIPKGYNFEYRSSTVGLDNCWDLWTKNNEAAILSIRGSTENAVSWLSNFYAAMVPAKGELKLNNAEKFKYELAPDHKAAVHIGWLVSMAFLSKDMLPKIDSCYKSGIKDIYIIGHSQGGAIAYLLTAYLYQLRAEGTLPADINFKTYCSASPKPGNLYFAYHYESLTQEGWAYNVVNAADWVPEVPMSIQTLNDFNDTNPFIHAKSIIKAQKFPKNMAIKHVYNQLDRPTRKAQKNYQKYLGKMTSEQVKKHIEGYEAPAYYESNNYVRTGNTIVLTPDEAYFKEYPIDKEKIFNHHFHSPHMLLASKLPDPKKRMAEQAKPDGTWELIALPDITTQSFDSLYSERKATITFDSNSNRCSGTTSCNNFNGTFSLANNKIVIDDTMAMTRKFCMGNGEQLFVKNIMGEKTYRIEDNTLVLIDSKGNEMKFVKK